MVKVRFSALNSFQQMLSININSFDISVSSKNIHIEHGKSESSKRLIQFHRLINSSQFLLLLYCHLTLPMNDINCITGADT